MGHARKISGLPLATPRPRTRAGDGPPFFSSHYVCRLFRRESEKRRGRRLTLSRWRQAALSPGDFSVRSAGFHTHAYLATENRGVIMMNNTSATNAKFRYFWDFSILLFKKAIKFEVSMQNSNTQEFLPLLF